MDEVSLGGYTESLSWVAQLNPPSPIAFYLFLFFFNLLVTYVVYPILGFGFAVVYTVLWEICCSGNHSKIDEALIRILMIVFGILHIWFTPVILLCSIIILPFYCMLYYLQRYCCRPRCLETCFEFIVGPIFSVADSAAIFISLGLFVTGIWFIIVMGLYWVAVYYHSQVIANVSYGLLTIGFLIAVYDLFVYGLISVVTAGQGFQDGEWNKKIVGSTLVLLGLAYFIYIVSNGIVKGYILLWYISSVISILSFMIGSFVAVRKLYQKRNMIKSKVINTKGQMQNVLNVQSTDITTTNNKRGVDVMDIDDDKEEEKKNKDNDKHKHKHKEVVIDTEIIPDQVDEEKEVIVKGPNVAKEIAPMVVGYYIRKWYKLDDNYNETLPTIFKSVPQVLVELILKYVEFNQPKRVEFKGATKNVKKILRTMNIDEEDGYIEYDEQGHHLKIHCFGDCSIQNLALNSKLPPAHQLHIAELEFERHKMTNSSSKTQPQQTGEGDNDDGDFYSSSSGHLELIVNGTLTITGGVATNYLHAWWELTSHESSSHRIQVPNDKTMFRQKKIGGRLDIKCYNLILNNYAKIHSCGNEIGGIININVINNLTFSEYCQIFANAYHKIQSFSRKGGSINIHVGNELRLSRYSVIDVGGSSPSHSNLGCKFGEINLQFGKLMEPTHGRQTKALINLTAESYKRLDWLQSGMKSCASWIKFGEFAKVKINNLIPKEFELNEIVKYKRERGIPEDVVLMDRLKPKIVTYYTQQGMKTSICKKLILASIKDKQFFMGIIEKTILKYLQFIQPKLTQLQLNGIASLSQLHIKEECGYVEYNKDKHYLKIHCYGDCLVSDLSLNWRIPPKDKQYIPTKPKKKNKVESETDTYTDSETTTKKGGKTQRATNININERRKKTPKKNTVTKKDTPAKTKAKKTGKENTTNMYSGEFESKGEKDESKNETTNEIEKLSSEQSYEFYNQSAGHLKLIVNGDLSIIVNGKICTNCGNYFYNVSPNGKRIPRDDIMVRQKRDGGKLDIKCYNLIMRQSTHIHACGNEIGGKVNINVTNNMKMGHESKIYANSYYKYKSFARKGGIINIKVGNQLKFGKDSEIGIGGESWLKLPCSNGKILVRCKSLQRLDLRKQINYGDDAIIKLNGKKIVQTQTNTKKKRK